MGLKRINFDRTKKYVVAGSIPVAAIIFALPFFLSQLGYIQILSENTDVTCTDDVCWINITFKTLQDWAYYSNESWFENKYGLNITIYRNWGEPYFDEQGEIHNVRELPENCTGSWCGCYWCKYGATAKYSYAFREGNIYTLFYKIEGKQPWEDLELKFFPNCPYVLGQHDKEDYFRIVQPKEKELPREIGLDYAWTQYWDCNPTDKTISSEQKGFNTYFSSGSDYVDDWKIEYQYKEQAIKEVNVYKGRKWIKDIKCYETEKNETCLNLSRWEPVYEKKNITYENIYWSQDIPETKPGECRLARVYGKLKVMTGQRNIEHIPVLYGYEFKEYDWWNISYYRFKINTEYAYVNLFPIPIPNRDDIFWIQNATGSETLYVYCDSEDCSGDVEIANGTAVKNYENASSITGRNPQNMWTDENAVIVHHFNYINNSFNDTLLNNFENNPGAIQINSSGKLDGFLHGNGNSDFHGSPSQVYEVTSGGRIIGNNPRTIMGLVYMNGSGGNGDLNIQGNNFHDTAFFCGIKPDKANSELEWGGYYNDWKTTNIDANNNTWFVATWVWDGTDTITIYQYNSTGGEYGSSNRGSINTVNGYYDSGVRATSVYIDELYHFSEAKNQSWVQEMSYRLLGENVTVGTSEEIQVSKCQDIDESGRYNLTTDILNNDSSVCFTISASNVIFDCDGHQIDGIRGSTKAFITQGDNITIKNCDGISHWYNGIWAFSGSDVNIENVYINVTDIGVYVSGGNNVIVQDSTFDYYWGVWATVNTNVNVSNCTFNWQEYAIITQSHDNRYWNNTIITNLSYAIRYSNAYNNTFYNNYVNYTGQPVWFEGTEYSNYWNNSEKGNMWINDSSGNGFSQICQDCDGDGICDSTYTISSKNIDYLPQSYNTEFMCLNGTNGSAYYEYGSVAYLTGISNGYVCIGINLTGYESMNCSQDNVTYNFNTFAKSNEYNGSLSINLTTDSSLYIGDKKEHLNTSFDIYGWDVSGYPENITIDKDEDGQYDLHFPGKLKQNKFYVNTTDDGDKIFNLTFISAGIHSFDITLPANTTCEQYNMTISGYSYANNYTYSEDFLDATSQTGDKYAEGSGNCGNPSDGVFTDEAYEKLWYEDNVNALTQWKYGNQYYGCSHSVYGGSAQEYRFQISEDPDTLSNITFLWNGTLYNWYGGDCGLESPKKAFQVYNYTTFSWYDLDSSLGNGQTTAYIDSGFSNIIDNTWLKYRVINFAWIMLNNCNYNYISTDYTNITVKVNLTYPENVSIDVGFNGDYEYETSGVLNSEIEIGNSTMRSEVQSEIESSTDNWFVLSTGIKSVTSGIVEIRLINLTYNLTHQNYTSSRIDIIDNTDSIGISCDDCNKIEISNIYSNFYGDVDYNVSTNNTWQYLFVRYSNYSYDIVPQYDFFDDIYFVPRTNNSKNVEPFGQDSTYPVLNITGFTNIENFDLYLSSNNTDSCMVEMASNTSGFESVIILNTTRQKILNNCSSGQKSYCGGIWLKNNYTNCSDTNMYYEPYYFWESKCVLCQ